MRLILITTFLISCLIPFAIAQEERTEWPTCSRASESVDPNI